MKEKLDAIRRLEEIIEALRGPDGCPWDRKQTVESLAKNFLEESCEVIDAIVTSRHTSKTRDPAICEELGDLLMNVFLAARVAEEDGGFSLADIARGISEKLVRRHPHVFGDEKLETTEEVLARWKAIKAEEKGNLDDESVLRSVPRSLPPLDAALELGKKAAGTGFDWPDATSALDKVREEIGEIDACLRLKGRETPERTASALEHEIGDLLLAVVNFSRKSGVSPDIAMRRANERFRSRFRSVEALQRSARVSGEPAPTLEELEAAWQDAKRREDGDSN